jgi:hypothetical protein
MGDETSGGACSRTLCISCSRVSASLSKGFGSNSIANNSSSIALITLAAALASGTFSLTSARSPRTFKLRIFPSFKKAPVIPPIVPKVNGLTLASSIHGLAPAVEVNPYTSLLFPSSFGD